MGRRLEPLPRHKHYISPPDFHALRVLVTPTPARPAVRPRLHTSVCVFVKVEAGQIIHLSRVDTARKGGAKSKSRKFPIESGKVSGISVILMKSYISKRCCFLSGSTQRRGEKAAVGSGVA